MGFLNRFINIFKSLLPSPFSIAIILTVITVVAALVFTKPSGETYHILEIMDYWQQGLWEPPLLVFAVQMMLILVLGHALALTPVVEKVISYLTRLCSNTPVAALVVTFSTCLVALFNWGLGLIFGAILARKVAEHASAKQIPLNYPLIAAAGYSGLMIWHAGLSGSSLVKISEQGHIKGMMTNTLSEQQINALPETITYSETVFSGMNVFVMLACLILLPLLMYGLGKKSRSISLNIQSSKSSDSSSIRNLIGAEKLDHSRIFSLFLGIVILFMAFYSAVLKPGSFSFSFINPNYINFVLLGLGLLLHKNINAFLDAVNQAIKGASGILIQFPLYFGIMGIMTSSGLVTLISDAIINLSNSQTFPIFTLLSGGLVNVFVPSGGGQWLVQGPIIINSSLQLGVPLHKSILAFAYGDQLTNMMQPFWALPLLGITGLDARQIFPYTLAMMGVGFLIFVGALLLF